MLGRCAFTECLVGDDEEIDVAACISCTKPVHHMCSNTVHGDWDVRVCSESCCVALGLAKQASAAFAASASKPPGAPKSKQQRGSNTKVKQSQVQGLDGAPTRGSVGNGGIVERKTRPGATIPNTKTNKKSTMQNDRVDAPRGTASSQTERGETLPVAVTSMRNEESGLRSRSECFSGDDDKLVTSGDEHCEFDHDSDEEGDHRLNKPKTFFFTAADGLDLLRASSGPLTASAERNPLETAGAKLREQVVARRCRCADSSHRDEDDADDARTSESETLEPSNDPTEAANGTANTTVPSSTSSTETKAGPGITTAQANAATVDFIERQRKRHDDEYSLLREKLSFKRAKAEKEEARWKEECEFRKREADQNAKKWTEEVALRRSEMELRREELAVLKHHLGIQLISSASTQFNV
ncbi:unnamed protein product [Phytophthora fragariaefolia]|uniref:Unnamed protein product n=1 Tax=Phytophthora fragariaefolia TaxID=1490495 RepID=A0A9W7D180_9STRA|nr:unnamed protein product [Phytophthora fragariaefolia]